MARISRKTSYGFVFIGGVVFSASYSLQLAIEFCDAGSCLDVIRKLGKPFNEKQIRAVMRQVVSGVAYIHGVTPPICHRDIKAGNILLNAKGEAKIGADQSSLVFKEQQGEKRYASNILL